jgi:hypothetical protein
MTMPQGPLYTPNINAFGAKNVPNITAATVVKATRGTLLGLFVIVAGSAPGEVNDSATVGGVSSPANQVAVIPNAVGPVVLGQGIPVSNGIVVTPGTGQTVVAFYI